jgi:hypothetical protein
MITLSVLENDIKVAMKARESVRTGILRMLVNRIKMGAKNDGNREVTDMDVMTGIQKALKEVNETRDIYVGKGIATDDQDAEIAILTEYLPKQMTVDEVKAVVNDIVAEVESGGTPRGKAMMGPVMQLLKSRYQGQYDPKQASGIVGAMVAA